MHVGVGLLSRRQNNIMLALPVERLVGNPSTGKNKEHNSSHHHVHSSRHSLSPDSIVSESSSTISSSSSTSGESHISDSGHTDNTTENIPQSPYANESISPNNNYSCKMHVTMKKSEVSSAGEPTETRKNLISSNNSPQNNSSLLPNSITDSNETTNKSYRIPYYRHSNNNNSNVEKKMNTDSRRSLSPEQQKNDEVSLVVVKSEVDLDNTELEERERLRSNSKRLSPPHSIVESENEDMNENIIRNGERIRIVESANANRSVNHNGRRINNNNSLHSSAKESSSNSNSFISTSGDHRDQQQQHTRRNSSKERRRGSDEEEDGEQIDIDVDGELDEEDRMNCTKDRQRMKHHNNRIEDEDSNNIITSHHHNSPYNFNHNYRPPSRPLSTSSSISTFSTASSQSNFKGSNQQHQVHHYFHSHLHPHFSPGSSSTTTSFGGSHHNINGSSGQNSSSPNLLKFSIEDILRPDFGLNLTSPSPPSSKISSRSGPSIFNPFLISPSTSSSSPGINHNHPGKLHSPSLSTSSSSLNRKPRNGSVSSTDGHRPYRPSSVNCHSEDSNGSCKSRTREEVVDDSKVNPPVPKGPLLWPAWVYCTRYSDRPSSGPRSRRIRKSPREQPEEKRPRTAFTAEQLARLKQEFEENRYLTEKRRQDLALDLKLHENQIKIWFQNKRAKLKKSTGTKNGLALQLMAQGLYNHSTVPVDEDEEMEMLM